LIAEAIELQQVDRGTTRWGETKDEGIIFTPTKVFFPFIFTWVVEWHNLISFGINRVCICVLTGIAPLTGKG
jgi:hypothetical protein